MVECTGTIWWELVLVEPWKIMGKYGKIDYKWRFIRSLLFMELLIYGR